MVGCAQMFLIPNHVRILIYGKRYFNILYPSIIFSCTVPASSFNTVQEVGTFIYATLYYLNTNI